MATDRRSERNALRGLLIPDTTLVYDSSQSTLTQAGPRAGVPEPSRPTPFVMSTTGTQADGVNYTVELTQGGAPGTGDQSASMVWNTGGQDIGWDQPQAIHGWLSPYWTDSGNDADSPHIAVSRGKLVVCFPLGAFVYSRTLNADGTSFASAVTVTSGRPSGNLTKNACLLSLPSGRLLCFYWRTAVASFSSYPVSVDVGMSYSDDDGATWTEGSQSVLPATLSHNTTGGDPVTFSTLGQLRAAYSNGDIALIASVRLAWTGIGSGASRDGFIQWASSDEGHRFIEISRADFDSSDTHSGAYYDLATLPDGRIVCAWIGMSSTSCPARRAILGGAYSSLLGAEDSRIQLLFGNGKRELEADAATLRVNVGALALCASDDGQIFVYLYYADDAFQLTVFRSQDGGTTWEALGRNSGVDAGFVYYSGNNSNWLTSYCAVWWQGRVALAHKWNSDTATEGSGSIGVALLGGWSNVNQPLLDGFTDSEHRAGWIFSWLPTDLPEDVGWTESGTGTYSLASGRLEVSTTAIQSEEWSKSTGLGDQKLFFRFAVTVVTGTSLGQGVYFGAWEADGGTDYEAQIWLSTSGIQIRDIHGGGALLASASIDCTEGIEVMGSLAGSSIRVFYRSASPTGCRTWARLSGTVTVDSASPRASSGLAFGHGGGFAASAKSRWTELHYAYGDLAGKLEGTDSWDFHAVPKPLSSLPTYVDQGLSIRAANGPGWNTDSWAITPRYDYGITKTEPVQTPSPRAGWRSTTDEDDVYLAFSSGGDGVAHQWGGQLVAFGFFGVNWGVGAIQTRSSGGTWSTLLDFSSSDPGLIQLAYARSGSTLVPTSSTGGNPFFRLNELAGSSIYLESGIVCRIVSNTAGRWSTASGAQRPTITIDASALGALDALSGSSASIVPKDFVVITRVPTTSIRGVRVYVEAGDTAEGHFQIGTLVIGHVEAFADEYSWGRTIDLEPSVERTQLRGGTTRTRALAPPRRRVSFGWAEGVDATSVEGTEPEPDYLTSSSTASSPAVASLGHTPWQAYGLISLLDSGRVPVVYLPQIPLGSTGVDTSTLNRREQMVLAQVVSPVSLEAIQGDEGEDEVIRVANIELEEVV